MLYSERKINEENEIPIEKKKNRCLKFKLIIIISVIVGLVIAVAITTIVLLLKKTKTPINEDDRGKIIKPPEKKKIKKRI